MVYTNTTELYIPVEVPREPQGGEILLVNTTLTNLTTVMPCYWTEQVT